MEWFILYVQWLDKVIHLVIVGFLKMDLMKNLVLVGFLGNLIKVLFL